MAIGEAEAYHQHYADASGDGEQGPAGPSAFADGYDAGGYGAAEPGAGQSEEQQQYVAEEAAAEMQQQQQLAAAAAAEADLRAVRIQCGRRAPAQPKRHPRRSLRPPPPGPDISSCCDQSINQSSPEKSE